MVLLLCLTHILKFGLTDLDRDKNPFSRTCRTSVSYTSFCDHLIVTGSLMATSMRAYAAQAISNDNINVLIGYLKDKNFREKWEDLPESRRTVRKAHLDEVKQAYQYGVTYGEAKDNYDLIDKFENQVRRKFGRSPAELDYILYDMELPD